MITFYHQTKKLIGFWCKQRLNDRSLIQLSETLLVELTRIHEKKKKKNLTCKFKLEFITIYYLKFTVKLLRL